MKVLTRILIDTKEYDRLKKIEHRYDELMKAKTRAAPVSVDQSGSGRKHDRESIREMLREELATIMAGKSTELESLPATTLPPIPQHVNIRQQKRTVPIAPPAAPDKPIADVPPIAPDTHEEDDTGWYFLGAL